MNEKSALNKELNELINLLSYILTELKKQSRNQVDIYDELKKQSRNQVVINDSLKNQSRNQVDIFKELQKLNNKK